MNPLICNRTNDLLKQILSFKGNITEPFNIGIALGFAPLDDSAKSMQLIYNGVNEIITLLKAYGYPVNELDVITRPEFIVDPVNDMLITPMEQDDIKTTSL